MYQSYHLNQRLVLFGDNNRVDVVSDSMFYQQPTPENRLDLNSAVQLQLEMLPGIGHVRAGRILEYREQQGRFERVEDLTKVYGIGEKTLESIRELISIDEISHSKKQTGGK